MSKEDKSYIEFVGNDGFLIHLTEADLKRVKEGKLFHAYRDIKRYSICEANP